MRRAVALLLFTLPTGCQIVGSRSTVSASPDPDGDVIALPPSSDDPPSSMPEKPATAACAASGGACLGWFFMKYPRQGDAPPLYRVLATDPSTGVTAGVLDEDTIAIHAIAVSKQTTYLLGDHQSVAGRYLTRVVNGGGVELLAASMPGVEGKDLRLVAHPNGGVVHVADGYEILRWVDNAKKLEVRYRSGQRVNALGVDPDDADPIYFTTSEGLFRHARYQLTLVTSDATGPFVIANANAYWTSGRSIRTTPLSAVAPITLLESETPVSWLAVTSTDVVWVDGAPSCVARKRPIATDEVKTLGNVPCDVPLQLGMHHVHWLAGETVESLPLD